MSATGERRRGNSARTRVTNMADRITGPAARLDRVTENFEFFELFQNPTYMLSS